MAWRMSIGASKKHVTVSGHLGFIFRDSICTLFITGSAHRSYGVRNHSVPNDHMSGLNGVTNGVEGQLRNSSHTHPLDHYRTEELGRRQSGRLFEKRLLDLLDFRSKSRCPLIQFGLAFSSADDFIWFARVIAFFFYHREMYDILICPRAHNHRKTVMQNFFFGP